MKELKVTRALIFVINPYNNPIFSNHWIFPQTFLLGSSHPWFKIGRFTRYSLIPKLLFKEQALAADPLVGGGVY